MIPSVGEVVVGFRVCSAAALVLNRVVFLQVDMHMYITLGTISRQIYFCQQRKRLSRHREKECTITFPRGSVSPSCLFVSCAPLRYSPGPCHGVNFNISREFEAFILPGSQHANLDLVNTVILYLVIFGAIKTKADLTMQSNH